MTGREPRFPDGWHWDETGWVYFDHGKYKAWVSPKLGLYIANWRLADGSWPYPWGETPEHHFASPCIAMSTAAQRAEFA